MSTRAAIYARISQSDEKTLAVANQIATCEKLAAASGYEVVRVYSDDGISAYSGKTRPGFVSLVKGIRSDEFDVVLAVAEDRLTRSSEEKIGLQSDCVKHKVTWHTSAGGPVDPSTASGGLLATISGAIAQYESAIKKERLQRSVADRLAEGRDLGGPRPFGFEKDRLTIRETEATVLRAGYEMIRNGGTVYGVAKMFTASGIPRDRARDDPWRPQSIRAILLRPRNVGRLVVSGVQYADDLPAIVDAKVFEEVRSLLENPARAPRRGPKPQTWTAIGTVRCGTCGSWLSQSNAHKSGTRDLRCAPEGRKASGQRHATMEAKSMEQQLSVMVFAHLFGRAGRKEEFHVSDSTIPTLRVQVAELIRQRDVAQEVAMMPGANLATVKKTLSELGKAIEETQRQLDEAYGADVATAALELASAAWDQTMKDLETGNEDEYENTEWKNHWANLSIEERRTLVTTLLPGAVLMPMGQEHLGFRIKADWS
jgi:site-specific DNA recombinase